MRLAWFFVVVSDMSPLRSLSFARPARASGSRPNCRLKKCQLNRVNIPRSASPPSPLSRKPFGDTRKIEHRPGQPEA